MSMTTHLAITLDLLLINLAPSQGRGSSTHRVCVCVLAVCLSVCLYIVSPQIS